MFDYTVQKTQIITPPDRLLRSPYTIHDARPRPNGRGFFFSLYIIYENRRIERLYLQTCRIFRETP